jgi:hypothetical protein
MRLKSVDSGADPHDVERVCTDRDINIFGRVGLPVNGFRYADWFSVSPSRQPSKILSFLRGQGDCGDGHGGIAIGVKVGEGDKVIAGNQRHVAIEKENVFGLRRDTL